MPEKNKIDVIVVGAGPAGVACAITLARANKKVLLVERGDFSGSKNVFGGAIYTQPTAEIYPNFWESAPIERANYEHKYILLDDTTSTTLSYKADLTQQPNSYSVIRAKFDRWCVEEYQKAGGYFAPKTVVRELLLKNNKVVGIKTDLENYFADIVVIADGVNSLLAKQIGLRKDIDAKNVALGVKEVLKLKKEIIEQRFNLEENTGSISTIVGGALKNTVGLGYIYTNKDSISIGIGVGLDELITQKIKPFELLEKIKQHPSILPLIKDTELLEYSAHLIPEGGINAMPKLYTDGVMIVGDAAMLVNNVHWEGTNLAMISGKLAAETAIYAIEKNNFSAETLSCYQKKLENSFIFKDLKSYKDVMNVLHDRKNSYLGFWIEKINDFFKTFTQVNSIPKKQSFKNYIKNIFVSRSLFELYKDMIKLIKVLVGIFK